MKGFRLSLVEHIRIESWIMYLELDNAFFHERKQEAASCKLRGRLWLHRSALAAPAPSLKLDSLIRRTERSKSQRTDFFGNNCKSSSAHCSSTI
jgi:hypothetical protein